MSGPRDSEHDGARPNRSTEAAPSTAEAAALRDAAAIAARVAADEAAADVERQRLLAEPMPVLHAGAELVFQLHPDEQLHAQRHAALLERREEGPPSGGMLYLTSQRVVHVGSERIEEVPLSGITDMAVSMERLLLVELADGSDLAIEVDQPRLLRVQVAAARAHLRDQHA